MVYPHSDSRDRFTFSWLDLELICYAIAGLVAIGWGVRALAHWTIGQWAIGGRLLPILVLAGASAVAVIILCALRHHKRWLYLGAALAILGLVTFVLVSMGVKIPPSWIG